MGAWFHRYEYKFTVCAEVYTRSRAYTSKNQSLSEPNKGFGSLQAGVEESKAEALECHDWYEWALAMHITDTGVSAQAAIRKLSSSKEGRCKWI